MYGKIEAISYSNAVASYSSNRVIPSVANTKGSMFASFLNNKKGKTPAPLGPVSACVLLPLLLAACGGGGGVPFENTVQLPETEQLQPVEQPPEPGPVDQEPETPLTADEKPIVIALMLPLSGPEGGTGQALLRAATMALFDSYDPRLRLLPLDTEADPLVAQERARQAVEAGASVVLGPLLAENVRTVGQVLAPTGIPVIGFSNDSTVAAPGRFIMGFLPEAEVKRVVDHAVGQGLSNFGALVPVGRYGDRIRTSFGDAIADTKAAISAIESYPPDAAALFEPVKRLARYDERRDDVRREARFLRSLSDDVTDEIATSVEDAEVMEGVSFDAVLVPEGGALMRTLAPLLPFYEIDPNRVKLLGTGLWNDEGLLGEPPLQGGWFAAPDPATPAEFMARFEQTYGTAPPRLATLAYDAMALVTAMARQPVEEGQAESVEPADTDNLFRTSARPADEPLTEQKLMGNPRFAISRFMKPEGFVGLDGLFRFLEDGTIERSLAVLEVNRDGFKVIDPAPASFPAFGYALKN